MSSADAADIANKAPVQPVTAPAPISNWTFQITPYLWAAGLDGDVRLGPNAPLTHVDASFGDILDHLRFAAMATVEVRYARFGVVADLMYLSLAASATGPFGFLNAQLKDKTLIATVSGAYRAVDAGSWWLDLEAGARVWALDVDLGFSVVPLGVSRNYSVSKSWADPIIGIRARAYLNQQFFIQGYADVGGFGVASKSTWQLAGLIGYQYSPTISFIAGYRYMASTITATAFSGTSACPGLYSVQLSGSIERYATGSGRWYFHPPNSHRDLTGCICSRAFSHPSAPSRGGRTVRPASSIASRRCCMTSSRPTGARETNPGSRVRAKPSSAAS